MKQHVSILGILYIVFGAVGLGLAFLVLGLLGGIAGLVSYVGANDPEATIAITILGILAVVSFVTLAGLALPGIIVGFGLTRFRNWGRIGGIILSALNLLNFPFGTALGLYGLWALLAPDSEKLFS